LHGPGCSLGEW